MAEPTEADRERAKAVVHTLHDFAYVDEFVYDGDVGPLIAAVAVALADERERARAPFLALAEEYVRIWRESTATDPGDILIAATFRTSATDLRRAAEETGQ